jgi:hypothetical protein
MGMRSSTASYLSRLAAIEPTTSCRNTARVIAQSRPSLRACQRMNGHQACRF